MIISKVQDFINTDTCICSDNTIVTVKHYSHFVHGVLTAEAELDAEMRDLSSASHVMNEIKDAEESECCCFLNSFV